MSILFPHEIVNAVSTELQSATESVQIITAYCKQNAFQILDGSINSCVCNKRLMLRFRLDDIVKGSTDFSVLEYGLQNGWKVYIRFDLHAKTYIVDNKRGIVGSANATGSGLALSKRSNLEMATLTDMDGSDLKKIESLYDDAILVDSVLVEKMKAQIPSTSANIGSIGLTWDSEITKLFSPKVSSLFSHELPENDTYEANQYIDFLDIEYDGDIDYLKSQLRWSNAYLWLMGILEDNGGELYFGAITEKLHDALVTDPKPYRRDVKRLLANLLTMIDNLQMPEIIIDRPNYSQRVRLVK